MKTLILNASGKLEAVAQVDPDSFSEQQFEYFVAQALSAAYPDYYCITLGGAKFRYQDDFRKPDLALVARDYSHWFVIEVELSSHSFDHHVLQQARCFALGEPTPSCVTALATGLGITSQRAATIAAFVPRSAAIISNRWDRTWATSLKALTCQMLSVSVFGSSDGMGSLEISGRLECAARSIAFGRYVAIDRAIRFHKAASIPTGQVEIVDPSGFQTRWTIRTTSTHYWVTKVDGQLDLPHDCSVQILQDIAGKLSIRVPYVT